MYKTLKQQNYCLDTLFILFIVLICGYYQASGQNLGLDGSFNGGVTDAVSPDTRRRVRQNL